MTVIRVRGVFKVRGRGGVAYHYLGRGGPRFWRTGDSPEGSPAYLAALARAQEQRAEAKDHATSGSARLADRFRASADFARLAPRTRADYALWLRRWRDHFGPLEARAWEDPLSRRDLVEWRDGWAHSPKQADYAVTVAVRLLNWARDAGLIAQHHCGDLARLYRADRAEIVWTPDHVAAFRAVAPADAQRALDLLLETGLAPGDACRLSRGHVEATKLGRRILIRRGKTGRPANIPVGPALARLIDATPPGRLLILVTARGRPFTPQRLSQYLAHWMRRADLPAELRVSDTRGTAATRLLRQGLELEAIARLMGWSLRYAHQIVEHYATVDPDAADDVLVRLHGPQTQTAPQTDGSRGG